MELSERDSGDSPTPASIPGDIRIEGNEILTHFRVNVIHNLNTIFHPSHNKG